MKLNMASLLLVLQLDAFGWSKESRRPTITVASKKFEASLCCKELSMELLLFVVVGVASQNRARIPGDFE
jgi:hypothetical protein